MNLRFLIPFISLVFILFICPNHIQAQDYIDTTQVEVRKLHIVIKTDGTEFIGYIISQDAREVLIETEKLGQVYIPRHLIKEIRELEPGELKNGQVLSDDSFSTRYFLTTNGLPLKKGDSYVQWNLYGPDFQFSVSDDFGLGIMTSWIGMPIIGSAKYSFHLGKDFHLGLGSLVGTGSWIKPDLFFALPYGSATLGNRKSNITLSGGYGYGSVDGEGSGEMLLSVAGLAKVSNKISIVLDSFIVPSSRANFAVIVPGLRWSTDTDRAFQFGFAGLIVDGEAAPIPIPMVQWYRKL
jgi:hypothetical protein